MNIPVDQLNLAYFQELISNSVIEKKTIDYKADLNISSDAEKKEFLKDVSSFGNAIGGDIYIGISENDNGEPETAVGIEDSRLDDLILKIESLFQTGITPRIVGYIIHSVSIADGKSILIVRIPNSWNSPHRVSLKGHNRFWTRATNGKYEMDVEELRGAFSLEANLNQRIANFKASRLSEILSNDTLINTSSEYPHKFVFHLIPIQAFTSKSEYDIQSNENEVVRSLLPLGGSGANWQYTVNGIVSYDSFGNYAEFYRNGILETVNVTTIRKNGPIPSHSLLSDLNNFLIRISRLEELLKFEYPYLVSISLVDIAAIDFAVPQNISFYISPVKNRKTIISPQPLMVTNEMSIASKLRPLFDSLFNAYGYKKCPYLDDQGKILG